MDALEYEVRKLVSLDYVTLTTSIIIPISKLILLVFCNVASRLCNTNNFNYHSNFKIDLTCFSVKYMSNIMKQIRNICSWKTNIYDHV